jgi:excisionase family DNA binding protein
MATQITGCERQTYSVREAAKVLGLGRNAAYELVKKKVIRSLGLGGKILIPRREVERILAGLPVAA